MKKMVAAIVAAYESGAIQHACSFVFFLFLILYFCKIVIISHELLKHYTPDTTIFVAVVILCCFTLLIELSQKATSWNITKTININNAVEYLFVMEKLNILDYKKQREFIKDNNLKVYISKKPIHSGVSEDIRAKFYVQFIHHFSNHYNIYKLIAKRRLCFNSEDLEYRINEKELTDSLFSSNDQHLKMINELTKERNALQLQISELQTDSKITKLELRSEKATNGKLRNKNENILFESKVLLRMTISILKEKNKKYKYKHEEINSLYATIITTDKELKAEVEKIADGDPKKVEKKLTPSQDMHNVIWGELLRLEIAVSGGNPNQPIITWPIAS